ncbi:PQQ-binding-like beta-propeller repeat protein, partial [Streptomyces sp. NPDC059431]|uniref:outer membrane protein assembly factor BamB family protein n=1 Tax=Streptomyces sp. NPDC059431 TaxID=3346828 RepID=UPI0036888EC0
MDSVRAFSEELESFAADLRRLRLDRGKPSYRELAARAAKSQTGIRLPVSTQSDAFRGDRLPGLDRLMGLVRILHSYDEFGQERPVPPHNSPELEPWRRRWRELAALDPVRRSPTPGPLTTRRAPASGPSPAPAGGTGFVVAHVLTTWADNNWCAAFSPDGRILAVSGVNEEDAAVQLWDPVLGVPVGLLEGGCAAVALAFSPSGRLLAVGDDDGTVTLWDTETLEQSGPLMLGHEGYIDVVAFAADGRTLVTADDDVVRRWDTATGEPAGSPLICEIKAMFCRADGGILAALRTKHTLRLCDLTTGASIGKPLIEKVTETEAIGAAFSADGALLATTFREETLLWDTATATVAYKLPEAARHGDTVAFSQDGRLLATMRDRGTVRLWDPSTGTLLAPPLAGHKGPFDRLAISPDGRMLAVCGEADTLVVYHDEPYAAPLPPTPLAARALASALRTHQAVALPALSTESGVALRGLAFSPDGTRLLVRTKDGRILTWDPAARVRLPESLPAPTGLAPWGLDFPADGGPARLWTPVGPPDRPESLVQHVAFRAAARQAAVIGAEGQVLVLDWSDGRGAAARVPDRVSDVFALAAARNGGMLAAAMGERVVLWDPAASEGSDLELEAHLSTVGAMTFSPDGRLLATGDADGHIMLWDVSTPTAPARHLSGHTGPVYDLAFSPQGHRLASAGADGTVQLWEPATGKAATGLPLTGHSGAVRGVAFSPDASLLAASGDDGTLRCWLLPTPHTPGGGGGGAGGGA